MVKRAKKEDLKTVANFAALLYNTSVKELEQEFIDALLKGETVFFLKYDGTLPVGFAECTLRHDYVEGTKTSPVGYLEGIYIKENYRNKGYVKELLAECEAWAKSHGCSEFASDCEIDNTYSYRFHKAVHFTEANRIICFTKKL